MGKGGLTGNEHIYFKLHSLFQREWLRVTRGEGDRWGHLVDLRTLDGRMHEVKIGDKV